MKHLFNDGMYFSDEELPTEDTTRYEYKWFETSLFELLADGSRDELERLAQEKLTRLKLQSSGWNPYAVIRDKTVARQGTSPTMRPIKIGFRLAKMPLSSG